MSATPPPPPPPGGYPPSGGGTPPPPPGAGGPPPPPGGYPPSGGAPPPPPGGGYGGPPPGGQYGGAPAPYSVSNAFNYGWKKFQENLVPWLLGVLILGVGVAIVQLVYQFIVQGLILGTASTLEYDPVTGQVTSTGGGVLTGLGFVGIIIGMVVMAIPIAILGMIVAAQFVRAGLGTVDQGRIELGKFFETRLLGPVVIAAIIAGALTLVGIIACYIGAIIVAFFVQFYAYFVLGEEQKPWDSIKSSFSFVNSHLANILVLYLASMLVVFLGALACGVGLLVAYPVVLIAHAYTFRTLRGEPVAP